VEEVQVQMVVVVGVLEDIVQAYQVKTPVEEHLPNLVMVFFLKGFIL
jgi:hypothetical protein